MSVVINGSAGVTTNSGAVYNGISAGTAVASTSGTSIDFTSIPSWVKRITVMFNAVSTNGTSLPRVQMGTSGGVETTNYVCTYSQISSASVATARGTGGFDFYSNQATYSLSGFLTLTLVGSNTWVANGLCSTSTTNEQYPSSGGKTLSGTIDRVRITTVNGTDTFDAGSINILYE